jgi:hypothetical protein
MILRVLAESGKQIKPVEPNSCLGSFVVEAERTLAIAVDAAIESPAWPRHEVRDRALLGNRAKKAVRPITSEQVVCAHDFLLRLFFTDLSSVGEGMVAAHLGKSVVILGENASRKGDGAPAASLVGWNSAGRLAGREDQRKQKT